VTELNFAHLSDLHLPLAEPPPRLRDLLSKRLFSYLSWTRSRRRIHRPEVLAEVMADVRAHGADSHMVVTGDLINLALPDEFERARAWLQGQGPPERLTIAPGNHDALVRVPWARGLGRWTEWMGDAGEAQDAFPFVKRVGEAALIGVSSAVPTAPFMATGEVGDRQLFRLARILAELGAEGAFRIVLIHHPPIEGAVSGRKALTDRAAFRQVLSEYGAELVLHGHSHHAAICEIPGPGGAIPVVASPSASAAPGESSEPAGWVKLSVAAANDAWDISISIRSMDASGRLALRESHSRRVFRTQGERLPKLNF
jgi:3',5'-cyclic AMP phosphodiesterase CpdA